MKRTRILWALLVMTVVICVVPDSYCAEFNITRGVNISHWLSQSSRRGEQRQAHFTEEDVRFIASLGYDHIRVPVDEEQLWDEHANRYPGAFELLNNAINWSREHQLRVIVDLHILRSHHFNAKEKPLWMDPTAQDKFVLLWKDLSDELHEYPVDLVAYELMNEPVADDPEHWNELVARLVSAIRTNEPERKIVIGSNMWQSVHTFDQLRVPDGDDDIILSFHFYHPMLVTHHTASWTAVGRYRGAVSYPGQLVEPSELQKLPDNTKNIVAENNGVFTRQVLSELIEQPLAVARRFDLPLYCGEWGCISATPRETRLAWYKDVRSILEENGISWANWDYKGGFGIVGKDGNPDERLIEVLIGRQFAKTPKRGAGQ